MGHGVIVRHLAGILKVLWSVLPAFMLKSRPFRSLGRLIHNAVCCFALRNQQAANTWFLRNTPLLCVIAAHIHSMEPDGKVRVCDIGCGAGAEIYSLLWMIRKRSPGIHVETTALDIGPDAIERARIGQYKLSAPELCRPLDEATLSELFERDGDNLTVRQCLKEGIRWLVGDANDPGLLASLGLQDVLIANNFLVHMNDKQATDCTLNLARLVRPGGLFVCRGVDLDVREKTMELLGFKPVTSKIEEIHNSEEGRDARKDWPWKYYSLEPLDRTRKNWTRRYAAIFETPPAA
jgi:chemotaxis methyl-accepting protein methylase